MRKLPLVLAAALGLALTVTGCAPQAETSPDGTDPETTQTEETKSAEPTPVNVPPVGATITETGARWAASPDGAKFYTVGSLYRVFDSQTEPDYKNNKKVGVIALDLATGKVTAIEDLTAQWLISGGPRVTHGMKVTEDGSTLIAVVSEGADASSVGRIVKADLTGATAVISAEDAVSTTGLWLRNLILSKDNKTAYVAACNHKSTTVVIVVDIVNMKQLGVFDTPKSKNPEDSGCATGGLALNDDGSTLYAAVSSYPVDAERSGGAVVAFDTSTGKPVAAQLLPSPGEALYFLNGKVYALADSGVWRLSSDKFTIHDYQSRISDSYTTHDQLVTDGKWLYLVSNDSGSRDEIKKTAVRVIALDAAAGGGAPEVYATVQSKAGFVDTLVAGGKLYVSTSEEVIEVALKG